jgi:sugar phosphate isomerase/epimerase
MLDRMGSGLRHLHLADGSGAPRDEHLVPGRGSQPCAEVLQRLADSGYDGVVVVEINTRRCRTRYRRMELLAESLLHARLNLQPTPERSREVARPTV